MFTGEGESEEPRRQDESGADWERLRRELMERALAKMPKPEPQPSNEEVESVFRAVVASHEVD